MSEQRKEEWENAMKLQVEAQAAEAHGQQLAMEKAGGRAEEIARDVAYGAKKVYQAIEKGTVSGYKAIENGVVTGYKAIENGVVSGFIKITDIFVGAFLTRDGKTMEQAKERLAAEQKAREEQHAERMQVIQKSNTPNQQR